MDNDIVLQANNISKQYRLGEIGTGTLSHDINRWWHKIRGKEDPYSRVGEVNDRADVGESDYVWALQDINFEVKQGEILGIIGKNGAGKSTLLKVLSKVTGPTTGSIKMKGRVASLLEVGTGFHPELTGRENIYLNGAILGMTRAEVSRKLDEIVDFAGVAKYLDTPVKRYSSGMMVRLGFAVAAHLEPEILIVDEVLAVGDVDFQTKAISKMKDVSKGGGRTVLFVSHNMKSIRDLCDRSILLDKGIVSLDGPTDEIINEYLSGGYDGVEFGIIPDDYPRNVNIKEKILLKEILLLDLEGEIKINIKYLEPVKVRVKLKCEGDVDDVNFIIGLGSADGELITYSSSSDVSDKQKNHQFKEGKDYAIDFLIDQNLLPGQYSLNVFCMSTKGYSYDSVKNFGKINIESFGNVVNYPWARSFAKTNLIPKELIIKEL